MTETPRETRVLDAVVSLVDSLLDDFDVVDLLTELTERCAELLDVAAAGLPARRPARTTAPAGRDLRAGPRTWSCSSCRPTKAPAWTATPPANPSPSPTSKPRPSAGRGSFPPRSTPASPPCTPSRCARPASCWARSACSAPAPASSTTPTGSSAQTLAHIACVAILQEHAPTPVDRDAAAALRAGQPRRRRAGQGLPARNASTCRSRTPSPCCGPTPAPTAST